MYKKPYLLMILDGVGLNDEKQGNAFKLANTKHIDEYIKKYANTTVKTSGLAVGLPNGQMGNSEVGHTNIGSGRIVYQELTRISKSINDGDFYNNEEFIKAINNVKMNDSALHLMGLVSNGGVHSHIDHLIALLKLAKMNNLEKVYIHAFLDGRDVPPSSAIYQLKILEDSIREIGCGKIVSLCGRYYAMDRDKRYDRLKLAYDMVVNGIGNKFKSSQKALENSYESEIFDEFVKPIVITDDNDDPLATIKSKDSCIFFNFRPDRAREFTHILTDDDYLGFKRDNKPDDLFFVTMTNYDVNLKNVNVAFKPQSINNTLGEVISKNGMTQLRIAETEKYAHVTFFFNGGIEKEYPLEDRILVPSPKVATYDLKPEMSAYEVTDKVIEALNSLKYDLIVLNYANGDMVGHTGNIDKAIEAIEVLDECVYKVISKIEELQGEAIITADHGNCEYMLDLTTGEPVTSHSTFDVPMIVISNRVKSISSGKLCDIAPTMLDLMEIKQPKDMTGVSLISKK